MKKTKIKRGYALIPGCIFYSAPVLFTAGSNIDLNVRAVYFPINTYLTQNSLLFILSITSDDSILIICNFVVPICQLGLFNVTNSQKK